MVAKNRSPLQVDPKFLKKLKSTRLKKIANGQDTSLRQLTEEMSRDDVWNEIEKKILNPELKIGIKLDRRRR